MTSEPYIIAEIGSNCFKWNSAALDLDCAYYQISEAKEAGAEAVKFQLFTAAEIWGPEAEGTAEAAELDRFALPPEWLPLLKAKCDEVGIDFMCSAFSVAGYALVNPHVSTHKIASPEVTAPDITAAVIAHGKPFLWSDGCSIALEGQGIRMLCVSKYPAHADDYGLPESAPAGTWGLSDHTTGTHAALLARQAGATYFEKHVDFFKDLGQGTPDSPVSCNKDIFCRWVATIRNSENTDRGAACEKYGRVSKSGGYFRPFPG